MNTKGIPQPPIPPRPQSSRPVDPNMSRNPDPMFSSVAHTQAGMPHLMAMLLEEYRDYVATANLTRQQQGQQEVDPSESIRAAQPLLDFFENYLKVHRPVQTFPIDMNVGVMFSNNQRCCISPGVYGIQGSMQDSGAVAISDGRSQSGQDGSVPVNY